MKSFIISLSLLVVFVALTALNCLRVGNILGNVMDSLNEMSESTDNSIPEDAPEKAEALYEYWSKNRGFLSLSINNAELRDCGTALAYLAKYSDSDTGADYDSALSEARIRISFLAECEGFSLYNIL